MDKRKLREMLIAEMIYADAQKLLEGTGIGSKRSLLEMMDDSYLAELNDNTLVHSMKSIQDISEKIEKDGWTVEDPETGERRAPKTSGPRSPAQQAAADASKAAWAEKRAADAAAAAADTQAAADAQATTDVNANAAGDLEAQAAAEQDDAMLNEPDAIPEDLPEPLPEADPDQPIQNAADDGSDNDTFTPGSDTDVDGSEAGGEADAQDADNLTHDDEPQDQNPSDANPEPEEQAQDHSDGLDFLDSQVLKREKEDEEKKDNIEEAREIAGMSLAWLLQDI
jgi:hypothetical protein